MQTFQQRQWTKKISKAMSRVARSDNDISADTISVITGAKSAQEEYYATTLYAHLVKLCGPLNCRAAEYYRDRYNRMWKEKDDETDPKPFSYRNKQRRILAILKLLKLDIRKNTKHDPDEPQVVYCDRPIANTHTFDGIEIPISKDREAGPWDLCKDQQREMSKVGMQSESSDRRQHF